MANNRKGEIDMCSKNVVVAMGVFVVVSLMAEAREILSLESVLRKGQSSSNQWSQDAFYRYGGRGGLRVLQVIPGGLMGGGGVLVTAPQSDYMSSYMTIFIRGAISGVVDGDALPRVDLKLDGTYQYTTALGATATVRAFRQLTSRENEWIQDTLAEESRQRKTRMETERKTLRDTIAKTIKEIETSYLEEQEKAKKAIEDFFSTLKIDLLKNVYIERSLLLNIGVEVQRNVKLDELKQAMLSKDWERCFVIAYENFFKGWDRGDGKMKPIASLDQAAVQAIFAQIENYDFVENGDDSFKDIFKACDQKDWNVCVNIADQILKRRAEGAPVKIDINDAKTKIMGYPCVEDLKAVFSEITVYNFPCVLKNRRSSEQMSNIVVAQKCSKWDSIVKSCTEGKIAKPEVSHRIGRSGRRGRSGLSDINLEFFEKAQWLYVQLQGLPCYIAKKKTIDDISEDGARRARCLSVDFAEDKISETEYRDGIISVAKNLDNQIDATFVNINSAIPNKDSVETGFAPVGSGQDNQTELAEYVKSKFASLRFDIVSNTYVAPKWRNLVTAEVVDLWPRRIEELICAEKWLELVNAVSEILGFDAKYDSIPNTIVIDGLYRLFQQSVVNIKIGLVNTEEGDNIRKNNKRDGLSVFFVDERVNDVQPLKWYSKWTASLKIRAFGTSPTKIFIVDNMDGMSQDDYSAGVNSSVGSAECEKFVSYCIKHTSPIMRSNCSYSDGMGFGLSKTSAMALTSGNVQSVKADKELFSRLWKTIKPENPNASKVEQNLSRLKCGMENDVLAKIYDKYSDDKCKDVLSQLVSEMRSARSLKTADERAVVRENLLSKYKGMFLISLSQRMNKIINSTETQESPVDATNDKLSTTSHITCPNCKGLRYIKEAVECSKCRGQGKVTNVSRGFGGTISTLRQCPQCNGKGIETKRSPCETCKGKGRLKTE